MTSAGSDVGGAAKAVRLQLVSVTRSLEWAVGAPTRLPSAPWLGTSCARAVDRAVAVAEPALAEELAGLRDALVALDGLDGDARHTEARGLLARVDALAPLSVAALTPALLDAPGRLVVPRRSRKERRRRDADEVTPPAGDPTGAGAPEPSDVGEGQGAVEAAEDAAVEVTPDAAPEPEPEPEPKPPAAPRRLALGHPAGSGRPLSALETEDGDPIADQVILEALSESGIDTIADLLLTPPTGHVRFRNHGADGDEPGPVTVRGRVARRYTLLTPHGSRRVVVLTTSGEREVECRWMGARPPRGWARWSPGVELAVVGEVEEGDGVAVAYEAEVVGVDGRGSGFLPEYDLDGVDARALRDLMAAALESIVGVLDDPLPPKLLEHLRDAHFPANTGGRGRVRMAFEELLLIQLGVAWRGGRGRPERGLAHRVVHHAIGQLEAQHQIRLEDGQESAFSEIRRDLRAPRPMARLLQGDVGAGKSLVCLFAALVVAENGNQVAMISPDATAAERRFLHAEALLRSVGISSLFVPGAPNHAQADAIRRGEAQILFGTGALLASDLGWKRLGLVVVEERGPYGTVTPASLPAGKGPRPDLLVTTRVPIPSSLTFTVFGELDVSNIGGTVQPRVGVRVMTAAERAEAYALVREQIAHGRQAFVVLPVREGRDLLGYADAMRMAEALGSDALAGARIGVYSTDMSREERSRAFDDFRHRRIDVLVCTTYIEDAPTVSNATVMMVEYADLHDAVRLHRLRGHVSFGHTTGRCFYVLSDEPAADAAERVALVADEPDGYRLAEIDLAVRGASALLGDRASEMPSFQWSDPPQDRELLLRARKEAFDIINRDGGLRRSSGLMRMVSERWGDWLGEQLPEPAAGPQAAGAKNRRRRRRRRR